MNEFIFNIKALYMRLFTGRIYAVVAFDADEHGVTYR